MALKQTLNLDEWTEKINWMNKVLVRLRSIINKAKSLEDSIGNLTEWGTGQTTAGLINPMLSIMSNEYRDTEDDDGELLLTHGEFQDTMEQLAILCSGSSTSFRYQWIFHSGILGISTIQLIPISIGSGVNYSIIRFDVDVFYPDGLGPPEFCGLDGVIDTCAFNLPTDGSSLELTPLPIVPINTANYGTETYRRTGLILVGGNPDADPAVGSTEMLTDVGFTNPDAARSSWAKMQGWDIDSTLNVAICNNTATDDLAFLKQSSGSMYHRAKAGSVYRAVIHISTWTEGKIILGFRDNYDGTTEGGGDWQDLASWALFEMDHAGYYVQWMTCTKDDSDLEVTGWWKDGAPDEETNLIVSSIGLCPVYNEYVENGYFAYDPANNPAWTHALGTINSAGWTPILLGGTNWIYNTAGGYNGLQGLALSKIDETDILYQNYIAGGPTPSYVKGAEYEVSFRIYEDSAGDIGGSIRPFIGESFGQYVSPTVPGDYKQRIIVSDYFDADAGELPASPEEYPAMRTLGFQCGKDNSGGTGTDDRFYGKLMNVSVRLVNEPKDAAVSVRLEQSEE